MNFCLLFSLYIGFHSFFFSLYSAEENEQTSAAAVSAAVSLPPPQKLMGIEIETSCIKIDFPTSSKIGFYFRRPSDGKCIRRLEEDTLDPTFSASTSSIKMLISKHREVLPWNCTPFVRPITL